MQVQLLRDREKMEKLVGEGLPLRAEIRLQGQNPWENLAREEALWEILPPGALWLVTYVNSACVVLGKHQNPLREVKFDELSRRQLPLLRRLTGGGTVWHDEGNLNFSFLASREVYDRAGIQSFLLGVLARLGFEAEVTEKGDLLVNGRKVSGNAYAFRKDKVLHHGTLLCSARLNDLRSLLGTTGELLEWVGVASRPMSVTNLTQVEPQGRGTVPEAQKVLADAFRELHDSAEEFTDWEAFPGFREAADHSLRRLKSPVWLWGQTPAFRWRGPTIRGVQTVRVEEGRVVEAEARELVGRDFFSGAVLPKELL